MATILKTESINIRDPFVLFENGMYYMYGTRAKSFGINTGGFDVYVSTDLKNWSQPIECFNSVTYGMNAGVNWAPEVHKYGDAYYLFATFTGSTGITGKGTYILKSDSPLGPFVPHSKGKVTPDDWECLDGTLYTDKEGKAYIVFCHEHQQILDGTICYTPLSSDLSETIGETVTLFKASDSHFSEPLRYDNGEEHWVTDGPFMWRSSAGGLFMLWSTFINNQYAECVVRFNDGELSMNLDHLPPLNVSDGGHGMIFGASDGEVWLTYHMPNVSGFEHPHFTKLNVDEELVSILE